MSRVLIAGAESGPVFGHTYSDESDNSTQGKIIELGVFAPSGEAVVPVMDCGSQYAYLMGSDTQFNYGVKTEGYFRGFVYQATAVARTHPTNWQPFLLFSDGSGLERYHFGNGNEDFGLRLGTNGELRLSREANDLNGTTGTNLATSATDLIMPLTLYKIDVYYKVDNAAGRFTLKVDGNIVIDYTGDLLSTINISGGESIVVPCGAPNFSGYVDLVWDSICVNDTAGSINNSWVDDDDTDPSHVVGVVPAGMGTGSNNLSGTADATNRYNNIDERPPVDTDYNSDTVAGQYDLYTLDPAVVFQSVKAVSVWVRSTYPGAASTFKVVTKMGGAEYRTAAFAPTKNTTYAPPSGVAGPWFRHIEFDLAPDGTVWTPASLAACEFGVEVATSQELRVTSLILEVDGVTTSPACAPAPCMLDPTDDVLFVDATSTDIAVLLPVAANAMYKLYYIKRKDAVATNTVTLTPDGTETIDGFTTYDLDPLDSATLYSDGADWWLL